MKSWIMQMQELEYGMAKKQKRRIQSFIIRIRNNGNFSQKKITNTLKTTPNNDFPKFSCTENSNSMPSLKSRHRI